MLIVTISHIILHLFIYTYESNYFLLSNNYKDLYSKYTINIFLFGILDIKKKNRYFLVKAKSLIGNKQKMGIDANTLLLDIEHLAYSGIVLSSEQRAALQTSLAICRDQYKFKRIYFWGRILGTKDDYYIAKGVGKNEVKDRTTLYRYE